MPDYRLMQSSDCLRAVDLGGKPRVVTIVKVTQGKYTSRNKGEKDKNMPDLWFREFEVPLGANSTNCKSIFQLFGTRITEEWVGRTIEIYPTTTEVYDRVAKRMETKECIRVTNRLPKEDRGPQQRRQPAPPQQRQQPLARGTAPARPDDRNTAAMPMPSDPPPPDDDELALIAARDREDASR